MFNAYVRDQEVRLGEIKGVEWTGQRREERGTFVDEIKQSFRGSSSSSISKNCKTRSYKINSLSRRSHVNVNQLMKRRTVASLRPRTGHCHPSDESEPHEQRQDDANRTAVSVNDHSVEQHQQSGETILIDRDLNENEEWRRNQDKLIKEEEVEETPIPHSPEVPASMIGIQKIGISKKL